MNLILYFDLVTLLLLIGIWIGIIWFLWYKKRKNFIYLLFFTLFYIYIVKVLDYTLFQFQSLLLLKQFMPNLILNGQEANKNLNLIPLIGLKSEDIKTSLLNILMLIPFGFGLPFITNMQIKKIMLFGALFSIIIELLQFTTGYVAHITFRIADINDVIFNSVGVVVGYMLFILFVKIVRSWKVSANPILRYIEERRQINK